jgi:CrcB protein
MKEYIYIGFGGFTGAILRYLASDIDLFSVPAVNTFFINITGSFILSFIVFSEIIKNIKIKKSFTMGLLGSFTTFSTFSGEAFDMLMNDKHLLFTCYICLSVIFGLIAVYSGYIISNKLKKSEQV